MRQSLRHAKQTFDDEGLIPLSKKAIRLAKTKKLKYVDNNYWDWRGGTQDLKVKDTSAQFEARTDSGGGIIRWLYLNEKQMASEILEELNKDDIFFDIGANIGFFTCFATNYLSDGLVVAFEPHPPNIEQLQKNLSYNHNENADVREVALSDSKGEVQFANTEGLSQTAALSSNGDTTSVEQIKGDDLADQNLPIPSVVKIDVEGAEPRVINGLEETLGNPKCRTIFCEIHLPRDNRPSIEDHGYELNEVFEMIEEFGFKTTTEERRGDEIHLKAQK